MQRKHKNVFFILLLTALTMIFTEMLAATFHFQNHSNRSLALMHYAQRLKLILWPETNQLGKVGIWVPDQRYGFAHKPDTQGFHRTMDFDATYTIGHQQERKAQVRPDDLGEVLILGASNTFGHGVNDDQTYPYLLGQFHWLQWRVINTAVVGWGTAQAYLKLMDTLAQAERPKMVLYAMIPHHIHRNYLRRSWVLGVGHYGMFHPHFEIVDYRLLFKGVVDTSETYPDGPDLRKKEIALTNKFLLEMHAGCEQRDIAFVVILLPSMVAEWPPAIIKTLIEGRIPWLDLSDLPLLRFTNDRHFSPPDHRKVAKAIADSWVTDLLGQPQ